MATEEQVSLFENSYSLRQGLSNKGLQPVVVSSEEQGLFYDHCSRETEREKSDRGFSQPLFRSGPQKKNKQKKTPLPASSQVQGHWQVPSSTCQEGQQNQTLVNIKMLFTATKLLYKGSHTLSPPPLADSLSIQPISSKIWPLSPSVHKNSCWFFKTYFPYNGLLVCLTIICLLLPPWVLCKTDLYFKPSFLGAWQHLQHFLVCPCTFSQPPSLLSLPRPPALCGKFRQLRLFFALSPCSPLG